MPLPSGITFPWILCLELHELQAIPDQAYSCCRVCLSLVFWVVVCFAESVTLQYISLSQQHCWLLPLVPRMPTFFPPIFALLNLVTIHSFLEYFSGKDCPASSCKDHFTSTLNRSKEAPGLGERFPDDGDQRLRALPILWSFWKQP